MGQLKFLMIHCSATPPDLEVSREDIIRWHTSKPPQGRGWSVPGYNQLIKLNGHIQTLVEQDGDNWISSSEITNGAVGYNGITQHICFAGGSDHDGNPLFEEYDQILNSNQFTALEEVVIEWLSDHQNLQVMGHNQANDHKYCPGFDVRKFLQFLEIPEKNIYQGEILTLK